MLDLDTFNLFFEEHVEELRRGGLKSVKHSNSSSNANAVNVTAITETLEPIANLATVCSRDGDKAYPRDDVVALFTRYAFGHISVSQYTVSTHPLNAPSQPTLSLNTPSQPTLSSTQPLLNPHSQPTLPIHRSQPTLSTHPVNIGTEWMVSV